MRDDGGVAGKERLVGEPKVIGVPFAYPFVSSGLALIMLLEHCGGKQLLWLHKNRLNFTVKL